MSAANRSARRGKGGAELHDLMHDGRSIVLACVTFYLSLVGLLRTVWNVDIWPFLGVPSGPSLFFDARNVAAAVECARQGHDPLVDNPCDPWDRVMFYPRVWLLLRWTGLEQRHTVLFGVVVVIVFLLCLMFLVGRLSVAEGVVVAAAVCSPAIMFAVERANMDLVVFSGLTLAAILWRRGSAMAEYAAVALVLVMAVAKLYPGAALLAFLPVRRRGTRVAAVAALLSFGTYLVATRDDVATISGTATQGQHYSYGARILLGVLYHAVLGEQWSGSRVAAQGLVLLAVLVGALALLLWLRRRSRRVPTTIRIPENADLIAFRMGVLVYVATFVVGNSFDYRLVFLLLVLPQLLRWPVADRNGRRAVDLPRVAMVLVLLELWISTLSQQLRLWDEAVSWALAGMLLVLLLRSLPSLGSLGKSEESDDYSAAGVGDPEGGH